MKKKLSMHINEKVHTPTYFFSKSRRLRFSASPPIPWCNMNLELLNLFFLLLQNFITSIIDISASNLGWSVGLVLGSVILEWLMACDWPFSPGSLIKSRKSFFYRKFDAGHRYLNSLQLFQVCFNSMNAYLKKKKKNACIRGFNAIHSICQKNYEKIIAIINGWFYLRIGWLLGPAIERLRVWDLTPLSSFKWVVCLNGFTVLYWKIEKSSILDWWVIKTWPWSECYVR